MTSLWFVGGSVRSGSTLLAGFTALTSDSFDAGELHLLWRSFVVGRLCTCGCALDHCPVWSAVRDVALSRASLRSVSDAAVLEAREPSQRAIVARGTHVDVPPETVRLRSATEDAIREVTEKRGIVDSSKVASTAVVASRLSRELRLLHLVRDPRAVAYSLSRPKRDPSMHDQLMPSQRSTRAALNWLSYNVAFERLARDGAIDTVRLRYEDVAALPNRAMEEIGLGPLPKSRAVPSAHGIAGNPWRFEPGKPIRVDERWRTELPHRDRRAVEVITYPLRRRYGYSS